MVQAQALPCRPNSWYAASARHQIRSHFYWQVLINDRMYVFMLTHLSGYSTQLCLKTARICEATEYNISGETVYEVPFDMPDALQYLNIKDTSMIQPYLSHKVSSTYLIVKERPGQGNLAEVMIVVPNIEYLIRLDSLNLTPAPVHITNVYKSYSSLGDFSGSVKFFTVNGVQMLEEAYVNGVIQGYVRYKGTQSGFELAVTPTLARMMTVTVCSYTYEYQQICGSAGCGEWVLIGVKNNGCSSWVVDDGVNGPIGGSGGGGGGGGGTVTTGPPTPTDAAIGPKPNTTLCGGYTWKKVGDAQYTQIRNVGATFVHSQSGVAIVSMLGTICVGIPDIYRAQGNDITGFINTAFGRATDKIVSELNNNTLAGADGPIKVRFKELMLEYLVYQPGQQLYGASMLINEGCGQAGVNIPYNLPKYCLKL